MNRLVGYLQVMNAVQQKRAKLIPVVAVADEVYGTIHKPQLKLLEKKLEDHGLFVSARKALQQLAPIMVVISDLAGRKIKKVT